MPHSARVNIRSSAQLCGPDGWRRGRLPTLPESAWFELAPDWACAILSPATARTDRAVKMPIYAHYGVQFAWLIDPLKQSVEAFELAGSTWNSVAQHQGAEIVALPPFEAVPLDLGGLWG